MAALMPQSGGSVPSRTYLWRLEYGQSLARITQPCLTGLGLLQEHPARGVVTVLHGEAPQGVDVLRQDHHRFDVEGVPLLDGLDAGPELGDMVDEVAGATVFQGDGEEEGGAGGVRADVVGHDGPITPEGVRVQVHDDASSV